MKPNKSFDGQYMFTGNTGQISCRLKIYRTGNLSAIAITRLVAGRVPDANILENYCEMALALCNQFSIAPAFLIWLEYYPPHVAAIPESELFCQIKLIWDGDRFRFKTWDRWERAIVESLVGERVLYA